MYLYGKKTICKEDLHCNLTQAAVIMSGEKFLASSVMPAIILVFYNRNRYWDATMIAEETLNKPGFSRYLITVSLLSTIY